jgi:hypothetical protein
MVDLLLHMIHFCASCVSDNNALPPAAGLIGGAAGAAGGFSGMGGGVGSGGAGQSGAGAGGSGGTGSSSSTAIAQGNDDSTTPNSDAVPTTGTPDSSETETETGEPGTHASSPFANESGGISEHAQTPDDVNPSDPFVSPQATPDPLFSDGPQVDGPTSPGDDSAETDYINPDGTPLGSSPAPRGLPHEPPAAHQFRAHTKQR